MPEVKDELVRVARSPLIKFSHSERFEFPLRVLISNNKSIDTFKEVFQDNFFIKHIYNILSDLKEQQILKKDVIGKVPRIVESRWLSIGNVL